MDTEEDIEIQEAARLGKIQTDEGPYYHEPWWEAYKGSVKGKLGGLLIGAAIGSLIGTGTALLIPALVTAVGGFGAVVGAFALGGLLYGLHEFSDIGKIVGSTAATAEKQEKRLKEFEAGKFAELKREIVDLKAALTGKRELAAGRMPELKTAADADVPEHSKKYLDDRGSHLLDYRTQHCDDDHCLPENRKWIFWKVAAIGLAVGLGAGALVGATGMTSVLIEHMFTAAVAHEVGSIGIMLPMTVLGLFGASFGINRDMFRQVFDKTDLWFKGILKNGKERGHELMAKLSAYTHKEVNEPKVKFVESSHVATVTAPIEYEGYMEYPTSSTYHRDKVLAAAEKALLSFDHTRATPQ